MYLKKIALAAAVALSLAGCAVGPTTGANAGSHFKTSDMQEMSECVRGTVTQFSIIDNDNSAAGASTVGGITGALVVGAAAGNVGQGTGKLVAQGLGAIGGFVAGKAIGSNFGTSKALLYGVEAEQSATYNDGRTPLVKGREYMVAQDYDPYPLNPSQPVCILAKPRGKFALTPRGQLVPPSNPPAVPIGSKAAKL